MRFPGELKFPDLDHPGVPVDFKGRDYLGNWSYGLQLFDEQVWPWFQGGLTGRGCVAHSGAGGPSFWIDTRRNIVGIYLATCRLMNAATGDLQWDFDLFQSLVTAAVVD